MQKPYKYDIYLASSWRNEKQPRILSALREAGYIVYDFKNPAPDNHGFHWSDIDPNWKQWGPVELSNGLKNPIAIEGYQADITALVYSECCVLLLPCGRSAHLELGYAIRYGRPGIVYMESGEPKIEPELMYKMARSIVTNPKELICVLKILGIGKTRQTA